MCYKIVCVLIIFFKFVVPEDILVDLPNGTIRGKESVTSTNRTYYSFLKVPYASPPVGELRFKAPIPPKNWEGVLDATSNRAVCYQVDRDNPLETEDCLYLNIYTSKLPGAGEDVPNLPVFFYIHGGGFILGTCLESICGPGYLIDYDVVVVTINYRLGPFGFLSTQDEIIPGNNGLKDQHLGIKWVHDNIKLFGGDPQRITIVGQSAGAASVAYQLLNKKSEGLVSGAICHSGSFLSPWSFQRKAREMAFKTASFINETFSSSNNSEELHRFLLTVSADELNIASNKIHMLANLETRQINQGYFYAPVIEPEHEDAFITRKMFGDLKSGNFVRVPVIIGITSEESLEDAFDLETLKENMRKYDENLHWLVPNDLNIEEVEERKKIGRIIRSFYTDGNLEDNLAAGIRYFSDTSFTRSVIKHAELHSKFDQVFFYQFSYDGTIGNVSVELEALSDKVAHTEDVRYIWSTILEGYDNTILEVFPEADRITHQRMLTLWTNFAKGLNPTPEKSDLLQNIEWPNVGRNGSFWYLDIDEDLTVRSYPKVGTYLLWNILYDVFGDGDFDTY